MKRLYCQIALALLVFSMFMPLLSAQEFPNYYDKYVNDFSGMFSQNETAMLRNLLHDIDVNTTAEVVIATIKGCGQDYNGYAFNLASNWKIGKADKDNGLLILYCQDENKLSVQTGYGLEGILPDSKIGRYLDDYYVPLRDENQTKEGIINFAFEIAKIIEQNKAEVISGQASGSSDNAKYIAVLFLIFIFYIIISRIIRAVYKKKNKNLPWFIPFFIPVPTGRSSGGFGGGGFGGGGFGGGGFGGGGASR